MGKASRRVVIAFAIFIGLFSVYHLAVGNAFGEVISPGFIYLSAFILSAIAIAALFLEKKRRNQA